MNNAVGSNLTIYPISEGAVSIEFGNIIDEGISQQINRFNLLLSEKSFAGMYQTVPAYTSLTIFYHPAVTIKSGLPGNYCFDKVCNYLRQLNSEVSPASTIPEGELVYIPVYYGGKTGPDLDFVATYHQITTEEVIRLHSSAVYKVYMMGFIPGFAYLGGLNDLLETPRKTTPVKVPAGSVGIAGKQTGVYPLAVPGGWQIIGQSPVELFNAAKEQPALLKAGDRVKFEAISLNDFENYRRR